MGEVDFRSGLWERNQVEMFDAHVVMGVLERKPALPQGKNETRSRKFWIAGYVIFTTAICLAAGLRLWWSWPDAAWLSNFWFIGDVDRLLNGDLSHVTWFSVGDQWALNGYRWFEYINASFFGFDARIENVCYYLIILALALLVGLRILNRLSRDHGIWPRLTVFLIPLVLASMSGAGSRGMELGTFTAVVFVVALFLLLDSPIGNRAFLVIVVTAVPIGIFVFVGGYVSGPTLALAAVWILQFWRPTLTPALRRRLTILTANFVAWTVVYFLLLRLLSPNTGTSEVSNFLTTVSRDPLIPFKYLFWGPAAGLFTSQTVDALDGPGVWITAGVSVLVILLTGFSVFMAYRRAWSEATVPLLMVLYPWGIAVTLLATRSSDVLSLLSTWYSLHFKVALVGTIWLAILGLRSSSLRSRPTRIVITVLLAGVTTSLIIANVAQFNRQPFERAYFLNIAKQQLMPSELTENAAGLTALQVPLKESLEAVEILRRHHLGVYRNPMTTWAKIYGYEPKFVTLGSLYSDGWAGRNFSVVVLNPSCRTLDVQLVNPLPTTVEIAFTARTSFGESVDGVVSPTPTSLQFSPAGETPTLEFQFSSTLTPSELGTGADIRELSAHVKLDCVS
ncbi:MAG: hypothetical protein ACYCZY_10070 [Lacisediminihabitans sp.]